MKKKTLIAVIAGAVILTAGGGYGIFRLVKNNASPVEVTKVSSLNTGWWGNGIPTSGIITSNATQDVYLDNDEVVDKVHVKEGDQVEIGDKLISYDTTLLKLDLESEQLERQSVELRIKSAEQDLDKLKKITPIPDGMYGDAGEGGALIKKDVVMTAAKGKSSEKKKTDTKKEKEKQKNNSPLSKIKAFTKLDYKSEPYKGEGTKEDPYIFFCKDGTTIYASFMNRMLGYNESGTSKKDGGMKGDGRGCYAILQIREGDSVGGGFVKSISINGTAKADKAYAPDITWTFASDGVTKDVPEVDEPSDDDDGLDDDFWGDDPGFGEDVYTQSELKEAIREKENEIKDLKLDLKEMKISVKKAKRKLDEASVTASIRGVVKSVGDPEMGEVEGEPFLTVTSSEGMYVRGTISELKLGDVQVGSTMTGMSYESGTSFMAEITEISEYPDTSGSYGWSSNDANASSYPFMAYIAEPEGLRNNESVELTMDESGANMNSSAIYLYKAYIRSENGQSYVYKADENNRLVKQYIKTGATVYSTSVEVKGGLTLEDRIAFPYGKNVVEGAKVKDKDEDEAMVY